MDAVGAAVVPVGRRASYRRGIRLVGAMMELGTGQQPLPLGAIAEQLGFDGGLTRHLLRAAIEEGLVTQPRYGLYQLTLPAAAEWVLPSSSARTGVSQLTTHRSLPAQLARLQRETSGLITLHALLTLFSPRHFAIMHNPGSDPQLAALACDASLPIGLPLRHGAAGHAMLPWIDPRQAMRELAGGSEDAGGVFAEALTDSPSDIRARGFARTSSAGWSTVAVPLLDASSAVGALSVTARAEPDPAAVLRAAERLEALFTRASTHR